MNNKKVDILAIFTKTLYFIAVILLFYIVGVLIQIDGERVDRGNNFPAETADLNEKTKFAAYFPECDLLNSECLDTNCDQYFLCSGEKYSRCEVYDCGEEFGIGTEDEDGKTDIQRKAKYNKEKIIEIKSRCGGTAEIIESDCINGKLEIAAKVVTSGNCKIEGFLVGYRSGEGGEKIDFKPAKFSSLGGGFYSVSVSACGDVAEIIAIGENGVSIK